MSGWVVIAGLGPGDEALVVMLRSSKDLELQLLVNGKKLGESQPVVAGKEFEKVSISLEQGWSGDVSSLRLDFNGAKDAFVEVDAIFVYRTAESRAGK